MSLWALGLFPSIHLPQIVAGKEMVICENLYGELQKDMNAQYGIKSQFFSSKGFIDIKLQLKLWKTVQQYFK